MPAAAPALPRVRIVGLSKRFHRKNQKDAVVPVDNVSLAVEAEEMLVLLGPSGCGKTTLLRCIAGLERPDEGEIYIDDQLVFSSERRVFVPPNERPVSMVFQSYALWPHMTVAQNVAYPLETRGVSRTEAAERVANVLETVGLTALAGQYPGQISGGQQQRVALARAVVARTGTVLFDEPLSNVDAQVREQLRADIRAMQRKFGFSAVYVTHDQAEAMALAHRVAVLDRGRVAQIGGPRHIYHRPASLYVGSFIGSANIWPVEVLEVQADRVRVSSPLGVLEVARDDGQELRPLAGQQLALFSRPEAFTLQPSRPTAGLAWPATVLSAVFLGPHIEYILGVEGETVRTLAASQGAGWAEGEQVWLSIDVRSFSLLPQPLDRCLTGAQA